MRFWKRDDRMTASSVVPEVTPDDKQIPSLRIWMVNFPGGSWKEYAGHELRVNQDATAVILEYTGGSWHKYDFYGWMWRWNKRTVVSIGQYLAIEEVK